jgi:hypothetical protein
MKRAAERAGGHNVQTEVHPFHRFYLAEAYHQKHYLRGREEVAREYVTIYPDLKDFLASTAVARANGYAGGYGTIDSLRKDLPALGLSTKARQMLMQIVNSR